MITKDFIEKLTDLLSSECDDYGISYDYDIDEENHATVTFEQNTIQATASFRMRGVLQIEQGEDFWENIAEYDHTVKYFWIIVAPQLWAYR